LCGAVCSRACSLCRPQHLLTDPHIYVAVQTLCFLPPSLWSLCPRLLSLSHSHLHQLTALQPAVLELARVQTDGAVLHDLLHLRADEVAVAEDRAHVQLVHVRAPPLDAA